MFSQKDFQGCIDLWESALGKLPKDIVTDMAASYAGGAYQRKGNRDKAIDLFTRSEDIGSLINLKAWDARETKSDYKDSRVKELEYIFNRFPNSPLLSIKLQEYVHNRETFICYYEDWEAPRSNLTIGADSELRRKTLRDEEDRAFYEELKRFAKKTASSAKCKQKGMWHYGVAYLYYLEGNFSEAKTHLSKARHSQNTPYLDDSLEALRILLDAVYADNGKKYRAKLLSDLKWLDGKMTENAGQVVAMDWQYDNKMNRSFFYWQDVVRKILLGEVAPRMAKAGNPVLALQLANYATNRVYQILPRFRAYHYNKEDWSAEDSYYKVITFDEYRKDWEGNNYFDYCSEFFDAIEGVGSKVAAEYVERIANPQNELDRFLNQRSYTDPDYLGDIVATHYLREMDYDKAVEWLGKVSPDYQLRTNIAKDGFFRLDPFKFQFDGKQYIADSSTYKLKFAREMARLEKVIASEKDPNRKAEAKIRFATGLRNSFGKCWYLTQYGFNSPWVDEPEYEIGGLYFSNERSSFRGNPYAQKAYARVDAMMKQAVSEFTDPERGAKALLAMKNYKTLMARYPGSKDAATVKSRCDRYNDYALEKR